MTIHSAHPFDDGSREAARQLRARLGGRVTAFTAGTGALRAAWTVSSVAVVAGDPWRVVCFVDPDCDLADRVAEDGTAVWHLLDDGDQRLADQMAGLAPAPGGVFRGDGWEQTPWGPRHTSTANWAGLRLESSREVGWLRELTFVVEQAAVGDDPQPLHHARGRYLAV